MSLADREAIIKSLISARAALEHEKQQYYRIAGDAIANAHQCDEDDKALVEMLARYGYKEPEKVKEASPTLALGGLLNLLPKNSAATTVEQPKPTLDEIAAKLIVDFGVSDAARRWCEWLFKTKQVPDPSPVRAFYDKFPAALKAQYNSDQANAVEALRAQVRSWIDKGTTTLNYKDSQVSAPIKAPAAQKEIA
jgi:hypothetical protein